jgi:flagellar M-ring protein FliF
MLVRNVSALLVAIVILLGVGRPLLKRRAATRDADDSVRSEIRSKLGGEISAELGRNTGLAAPSGAVTLDMISSTQSYTDRAALIRDFVKQDPDRAALVVRDLLKEGANHG